MPIQRKDEGHPVQSESSNDKKNEPVLLIQEGADRQPIQSDNSSYKEHDPILPIQQEVDRKILQSDGSLVKENDPKLRLRREGDVQHPSPSTSSNVGTIECSNITTLDVGDYVGIFVNDLAKKNLLLYPWVPPKNYNFPYSVHNKKGKMEKRYASEKHLNNFNWLVFSDSKQGYFCKYCPFFVNAGVGGYAKNVPLIKLVSQPLNNYAKLLGEDGALLKHEKSEYHKHAVLAAKDFLKVCNNPEVDVANQVNSHRLNQINENRARLKPILESVIFLGQHNIAFRGHRDDGPLNLNCTENEGNFRGLLKFRVKSGDVELETHLKTASARATYISKTVQNDLIECCGDEILSIILNRVRKSKFYSVLFDETTDISWISQLTLCLRYVYNKEAHEDFINFVDLYETVYNLSKSDTLNILETKVTGSSLGHVVLDTLKSLNLNLKFCVALATDGCYVMVSEAHGAVATVKEECVNAVYSPCLNHKLNLSLSKSSSVQAVRNAVGTMTEVINFFNSAKRTHVLKDVLGSQLDNLCETRWVERHEGVLQFRSDIAKIVDTLDTIASWHDINAASKAKCLKIALCESEFLIAMVCLSDILATTLQLSLFLQRVDIDVKTARDTVSDTIKLLERKRKNCDVTFKSIYDEVIGIAEELDTEIKVPRISKKQKQRENYPTDDAEAYYRQSIYVQLFDNIIVDLKSRFSDENLDLFHLSVLFPNSSVLANETALKDAVKQIAKKYSTFFEMSEGVLEKRILSELDMWKLKWERENYDSSYTVINLLKACDEDIYPVLHVLLTIFATIPCSAATCERSFSALKRLKTWLRSTMKEERLNGLALLHVHNDIKLDLDAIIDRYAKTHKHRLEFIL